MKRIFEVLGVIFVLLLLLSCCSTTHLWSYFVGVADGLGANTSRSIVTQQGGGRELGSGQYSGGSSNNTAPVTCNPQAKITLTEVTVPLSEVGAVWTATGSSTAFAEEPWKGSNGYFSYYCQGKIRWQYEAGLSPSNGGTVTLLVEARHWSNSDAAVEFLRRGSDSGGAVYGWSPTTKTPVILIGTGK